MDWVAGLAWNDWPDSHGIGVRFHVESVSGFSGIPKRDEKKVWSSEEIEDFLNDLVNKFDDLKNK